MKLWSFPLGISIWKKTVELRTQNAQLVGGPAIWILSSMVFDCKFCTCCLKLWSSELDTDGPVELFFNRNPRSQNHGSYRSKRIPGGQNYGSYCSKRPKPWELSLKTKPQRPSGRSSHGNGLPEAICCSSQKIQKILGHFSASKCGQLQYKTDHFLANCLEDHFL